MVQFAKILQPSHFVWNEDIKKYVVLIQASAITGFNNTQHYSVIKVLRKADNASPWRNVLFQYEIDNNGNLYLYFDESFTGKLSLITDT